MSKSISTEFQILTCNPYIHLRPHLLSYFCTFVAQHLAQFMSSVGSFVAQHLAQCTVQICFLLECPFNEVYMGPLIRDANRSDLGVEP